MNLEYYAINAYNIMIFSNFYLFTYFFFIYTIPFLIFQMLHNISLCIS